MTRLTATPARRAALAGLVLFAAACGRGANQSADRNGADTTSADTSATGPMGNPVSAAGAAEDSAFAKASGRLDSLSAAGVTANDGINTVPAKVQNQTANEPIRDTSRLNNRGPAPGQPSPSERRP